MIARTIATLPNLCNAVRDHEQIVILSFMKKNHLYIFCHVNMKISTYFIMHMNIICISLSIIIFKLLFTIGQ